MVRFRGRESTAGPGRKLLLSLAAFALVVCVLLSGFRSLSQDSHRRERETLENALQRCIAYCYAVEGAYPESLGYMKEHYGLAYNEDRFFVDYRPQGGNILPDVTVLEQGG